MKKPLILAAIFALLVGFSVAGYVLGRRGVTPAPRIPAPPQASEDLESKVSAEIPKMPSSKAIENLDSCSRALVFAQEYLGSGDYDAALEELNGAKKVCGNNPNYYKALGDVYSAEENWDRAFDAYWRAAEGFRKQNNEKALLECYADMKSIKPDSEKTKELGKYLQNLRGGEYSGG